VLNATAGSDGLPQTNTVNTATPRPMDKDNWTAYRELHDHGWDVDKENRIRPNSGSETVKHLVAKALVAQVGLELGYRVDSEVPHAHRGEIDVLLYGQSDRLTLAVECETSPTDEIVQDKVDRYVHGPIDDLVLVNVTGLPTDMLDAYGQIKDLLTHDT